MFSRSLKEGFSEEFVVENGFCICLGIHEEDISEERCSFQERKTVCAEAAVI